MDCCWNEAGAVDASCAVTAGGAAAGVLGLLVLLGLPGADGVLVLVFNYKKNKGLAGERLKLAAWGGTVYCC